MPTWRITTPDGLSFRLTGDEPPDEATIQGIERQIRGEPAPEEVEPEIPETSAFGAFGRAAGENVLPSAGGAALGVAGGRWAGTLAGARAGAALPIPHPVAKIAGGLIGGVLGFLSTSWAQRKIAEKVAPEATKEFETLRAADVERHPVASFSGAVAGALPSTQFNPLSTLREASTLFRGAPGAGEAAVSLGAKLGLGAGFAAAPAVMEGRLPTGRELGEGAAFGAILGAPRRWVGGGPSARVVVPPPPPPPPASGRFAPRPTELEPQPPRLPGKEPIQPEFVPPGMLPRETRVVKPWITVPFTPQKPTSKPVVPEKNVMSKLKASRLARAAERLEEERQPKPLPVAPALGLEEAQGRLPGGAAVIEVPREPLPELHPAHVDLIETIVKVASDRKATLPHLYGAMEALPTARAVVEGHIGRLEQRGQDASKFYDVLQTLETFENSYHEAMTKPQVARGKATTRDILGEAQAKALIDGLRKPPPEPPTEGAPPVPVEPVPPKTPPSPAALPPLRPGDKPIKIEQTQPDGSVTLIDAVTNDKNWEIGGKSIPNVGRPVEGLWSDGPLRPGEKIVGEPPVVIPDEAAALEMLDRNFKNLLGEFNSASGSLKALATFQKQIDRALREEAISAEQHRYLSDRLSERLKGVPGQKPAQPLENLEQPEVPTKEPTLFSDNPKLARPVSWWRKFATVQGAAKMGKDTRAALVQFTKVPNNPKAIADFISKRIGEVEGKAAVSETVQPVAETVVPIPERQPETKPVVPVAEATVEKPVGVRYELKSEQGEFQATAVIPKAMMPNRLGVHVARLLQKTPEGDYVIKGGWSRTKEGAEESLTQGLQSKFADISGSSAEAHQKDLAAHEATAEPIRAAIGEQVKARQIALLNQAVTDRQASGHPAIWIDDQVITETGKFRVKDNGQLSKMQDLSVKGFEKNLMDIAESEGEGRWWGANKAAKERAEKLITERNKARSVEAEKQAEQQRIRVAELAERDAYTAEWQAVDLPKGKKQTVQIPVQNSQTGKPEGSRPEEMTVHGSLGIRKNTSGSEKSGYKYFITHAPTGLSLGNNLKISTLKQAQDFIKALIHTGVDLSKKNFSNDELKALLQVRDALFTAGPEVPGFWKAKQKATPPPEPLPKGPGGNVGMSAATPGEFTPPPETDSFRGFSGWASRAKEVLQKVKEYFTPPHAGALPEVDIQPDAILPRLPAAHIENKIASSPQGMARVPGLGAIADPRATAHAPSDAPFLGRANSIAKGKTFATIWGQTQWANKDLFKVNPDTGTFPLTNGRQGHLSDVIEAEMRDPGSQPITINQYRWIHDEWIPLQKDVNKMLRDEGVREVHTDDMEFEVGKDYFPRPAIGKRNRPVSGPGGKPGGKPGARQFFQKSRKFATEEEGARPAAEGEAKETIIYDPDPISRVVKFISGAYRAVADHRLAIAPELGAGTVPEHWGVGRRVHAGPSFQGKVYPVEVAAKIEKAYGQEVSTPGRVLGEVTAAAKAVMATGDLSAPLIQGAAMFGRHPARWARSVAGSFKALFDSNYVARLMEQPRYKELRARASQSGVSLFQLQDFMSGTAEGQLATRLPVAGRVLKATGRAYGAFLDIAKLELFDAWSKVAPKSEWPRIAETVENSLFSGRQEQIGLNPHRALGERLLFFAPSYYRGAGGLVATAFQNSVSGKMARQMLGGYAASGLLVSLGAYAALGLSEDEVTERLDPSKGKFLKIPVELSDGSRVEVGIGNVLTQLVRLAGQAKDYHTEDKPIDTGVEANPYLRFLRARSAFMPSLAIELTTGRDYFGQRITAKESTVRHFAPFALQSLFPREEASGQQRAMDSAFTFFGLNAYPESEYAESLRKMDRLSFDTNQRPFSRSTPVQRAKIMGQFKRQPDYVKREPTPNDMERYIQIAEQRRRELASALPNETRKKMERLGLDVGGFKSTLRVNGQDVPLTESEREKYQQLLVEEYQRTIERLNEKAMLARRPDVLEKLWSSQREQIGIRARRRLLSELNRGKNGAK